MTVWLKRALAALALLAGGYLALANLFLSTPLGPWAINRRPEKLQVTWRSAWSLLPGRISVRDLEVRGNARRVSWGIAVERGRGDLALLALLRRRFVLSDFHGEGVRWSNTRHPEPTTPRRPRRRPPWRVELRDVVLERVEEIAVQGSLFTGGAEVEGWMVLVPGRSFELGPTTLRLAGGRMLAAGQPLVDDLSVTASASIAPYEPRQHRGAAGLAFLSGELVASGRVVRSRLLDTVGGPGEGPLATLEAELSVAAGELAAGSRLTIGPLADGSAATPDAAGADPPLRLVLRVDEGDGGVRSELSATAVDLTLGRSAGGPPVLAGRRLELSHRGGAIPLQQLFARRPPPGEGAEIEPVLEPVLAGEDLRAAGAGANPWRFELDRASARLDLGALFRRRLEMADLRGEGGRVELVGSAAVGDQEGADEAPAAEAAGDEAAATGAAAVAGGDRPTRRGWVVRFADAELTGLREVTVAGFRLDGDTRLAARRMDLGDGPPALIGAELSIAGGRLGDGHALLADRLDLEITAELLPDGVLSAGETGAGDGGDGGLGDDPTADMAAAAAEPAAAATAGSWLRGLSGSLRARGRVPSAGAAAGGLLPGRTAGLDMRGGGSLEADVGLERGVLTVGTRVSLSMPAPALHFGSQQLVAASATLGAAVEPADGGAGGTLDLAVRGLEVTRAEARAPWLTAGSGHVRSSGFSTDLAAMPRLAGGGGEGTPAPAPGAAAEVESERLALRFAGSSQELALALDRVTATLDLAALTGRTLRLAGVRGGGTLAVSPVDEETAPAAGRSGWRLELPAAELAPLTRLAAGPYSLSGATRLAGSLTRDADGVLSLAELEAVVEKGRMLDGDEMVASALALELIGDLDPWNPAEAPGVAGLRSLTCGLTVRGDVTGFGFLDRFLGKAPWLAVGGEGRLDGELRLERGHLVPGSRVAVGPATIRAAFLGRIATGSARLAGGVEDGDDGRLAELDVDFEGFEVAAAGTPEAPYVHGVGFHLRLTSTDLDLADPVTDLRAQIDLPESEVPDLRAYNVYLPAQAGVEIVGGSGRVEAHFGLSAADQSGAGEVRLTTRGLAARYETLRVTGDLTLSARLAGRDLQRQRFSIAGSRLEVDGVHFHTTGDDEEPAEQAPWWGRVELAEGNATWAEPLTLDATARLRAMDTRLLLALFAQRRQYLRWFGSLLEVEDLRGDGRVRLTPEVIELDPLELRGGRAEVRTRLRLARGDTRGLLYLRYGSLAAGLELAGEKRDIRLRKPLRWFESHPGLW